MSKNYDNWERLVAAVLLKERLKRIALSPSIVTSAISSRSSSYRSLLHDHLFVYNGQIPLADFNVGTTFSSLDNQETSSRPTSISCFLDEKTGKKSCMVGARDLKISLGNNSDNWKWTPHADSRFSEVAELHSVWNLDIRGKIETRMLDPRTVYAAYLVLKMGIMVGGLESSAKAITRFVDDETDIDAAKRARTVNFQPEKDMKKENLVGRGDGWMEVKIGNFYVSRGDDGEVEARLMEIKRWKTSGLIVEGILFRPTYTWTGIPLLSKRYKMTTVMA